MLVCLNDPAAAHARSLLVWVCVCVRVCVHARRSASLNDLQLREAPSRSPPPAPLQHPDSPGSVQEGSTKPCQGAAGGAGPCLSNQPAADPEPQQPARVSHVGGLGRGKGLLLAAPAQCPAAPVQPEGAVGEVQAQHADGPREQQQQQRTAAVRREAAASAAPSPPPAAMAAATAAAAPSPPGPGARAGTGGGLAAEAAGPSPEQTTGQQPSNSSLEGCVQWHRMQQQQQQQQQPSPPLQQHEDARQRQQGELHQSEAEHTGADQQALDGAAAAGQGEPAAHPSNSIPACTQCPHR